MTILAENNDDITILVKKYDDITILAENVDDITILGTPWRGLRNTEIALNYGLFSC